LALVSTTAHTANAGGGPPDTVGAPEGVPYSGPVDVMPNLATDRSVAPSFWEKCKNYLSWGDSGSHTGRCTLQSDHCFPGLSEPVTMPFYFEDPRALTEVKPIFMYQSVPNKLANFGGGNAYYFGVQGRVAITERWSVVMSELGFVALEPDHPIAPVDKGTSFAEIKIGPKYTFLRNTETGTIAAAGLNFEFPTGSSRAFQNTGSLSLDPYVTIGQTFGRLGGGAFNVIGEVGYSASVDNARSEFFHTHFHLDYNVAGLNTIFPLFEVNWLHYTALGHNTSVGTEGADLINFGSSTTRGKDYLSLAFGARYRFTDNIWAGAAIEFPTTHENGASDFRLTFDVIFRY
jgi:hypothetical protein